MIVNLQPLQIHQNLLKNPGLVPKPLPKLQRRESLGKVLGRVRTDSESVNGAKAGQNEAKEPSLTTEPSSSRELCLVSPADNLPSDDPSLLILDKQISKSIAKITSALTKRLPGISNFPRSGNRDMQLQLVNSMEVLVADLGALYNHIFLSLRFTLQPLTQSSF
ncbi:hypothetical protein YC2023_002497 [Brassica napus]